MQTVSPRQRILAASLALTLALPALFLASPAAVAVVGGHAAEPGQFPWMAAIYSSGSSPSSGQYCGGSLITPTFVATAAHCMADELGLGLPLPKVLSLEPVTGAFGSPFGQKGVSVLLGRNSLSGTGGEQITVKTITIHPDYDAHRKGENDIALLELSRAAVEQPIAWAHPEQANFWAAGVTATIAGWGLTRENGQGSDQLLTATVPVVGDADCAQAYGAGSFDAPTMVCAGFPQGGTDTCQGDSGGPFMVVGPDGNLILAGIVSFGNGCARAGFPGVYAEVGGLNAFIAATVR